ncbi:hypothetical protein EHQ31_18800 [Leptospira montravelensis]|uniref:Uncharacterized protein n=1 Tax=Leptospira montravelensis TaxID=2484961 RepID=A0ABY2LL02_9LEPT|nr:hypothetical protein [Leptospira montravelensis]TGK77690.1 hypothetical protein EHQ19_19000 [Leptospira montravelensis]TGK94991.1 hypothetical protein EHQ31_18800 [Leptospira montravelensis]
MKLTFSQVYQPQSKTILKFNYFDPILFRDSKYYIDPILIPKSSSKIISKSYPDFLDYFKKLLLILKNVKNADKSDTFWRTSIKQFSFKEISAFHLGYGHSNQGSGLTSTLSERILKTSLDIIRAGYSDPEIFTIVGFLEEGIGADRISDMVGNILLPHFIEYTNEILSGCKNTKLLETKINNITYKLPYNPKNNNPIILLPKDILRRLPEATDKSDIINIVGHNEDLRNRVNKVVGEKWNKVTKSDLKRAAKGEIVKNPEVLHEILNQLKASMKSYNFEEDPFNEESYRSAIEIIIENLNFSIKKENTFAAAKRVLNYFKDQIESNALWKNLYDDHGNVLKESHSQKIFHGLSLVSLEESGITVTPESNSGPGPVDFKYSLSSKDITLIEFKLSSNTKLIDGLNKQLPAYIAGEKAKNAFYVVIQIGDHDKKIKALKEEFKKMNSKKINLLIIDGQRKSSASNL